MTRGVSCWLTECIHTQPRSAWPADQRPAAMANDAAIHASPSSRSIAAPIPCEVPTTHSPHDRHFFAWVGMSSQHQGQLFTAGARDFAVSREIDRVASIEHHSAGDGSPYGRSRLVVSPGGGAGATRWPNAASAAQYRA